MPRVSVGRAELETRPHILYRFYDRTGVLLYIGITVDFADRMATHAKEKDWWTQVDRSATRVEYYDSRFAALNAEREAIKSEKPLENNQHNTFLTEDSEPCGDGCNTLCLEHHDDEHWQGRDGLAIEVIDEVRGILGDDERLREAVAFATEHVNYPTDERTYPDPNVVVITALSLVERLASDVARLRWFAEFILGAVSPEMLAAAKEAAEHDYYCVGEPDAPWEDKLCDTLRHLSYALAEQYGQPRPGPKRSKV